MNTRFITLNRIVIIILYSIILEDCLLHSKTFLVESTSEEIRFETSSLGTLNCYFHEKKRKHELEGS